MLLARIPGHDPPLGLVSERCDLASRVLAELLQVRNGSVVSHEPENFSKRLPDVETIGHSISNATESLERPAEVRTLLGNEIRFCGPESRFKESLLKYSLSPADSCDIGRPTQTHIERPKFGIEINRMLQRPSLEFMARNCRRTAVARAARTGPGAARLTLQVSENPIDDSGIGDDGDNLHLCAADTEKRIHLENLLDEAGRGCPASLNEFRGGIGRRARACRRRGLLLARGFRRTCAVGERSVIPHAMPKLPS